VAGCIEPDVSQMHLVHTFSPSFPKIHFRIILNCLFPSDLTTKNLYTTFIFSMSATFSAHINLLVFGNACQLRTVQIFAYSVSISQRADK